MTTSVVGIPITLCGKAVDCDLCTMGPFSLYHRTKRVTEKGTTAHNIKFSTLK